MKLLRLNQENLDDCVAEAAKVLHAGGIVFYPTDTLYALGADAFSDEAVAKILEIKGREGRKPISAMFPDLAMVEKYSEMNEQARKLAGAFLPGPLTLILKKRKGTETGIARGIDTIGIRIPAHPFCAALAKEFAGPITATSANRSGERPERSVKKILAQLGTAVESINLVIDAGVLPARLPSTIVDLSDVKLHILRKGSVTIEETKK